MTTHRKILFMGAGGVAVVATIAAIVLIVLFDINSYKPRIQTVASGMTGLDVKINGKMGLSFFPFGVSARDIHVADKRGEILSLERLTLRADLIPLLKKQLKVSACELVKPVITITKNAAGKYDFADAARKRFIERPGTVLTLNEFKLSKGMLVHIDNKTGEKTELNEINLAIRDMTVADTSKGILKTVSFTGTIDCKEVLQKDVKMENIRASMKATRGTYDLQPLTIGVFVYSGKKAVEKTEIKEIHMAVKNMVVADTPGGLIKNVSFTGTMDCKELRKKDVLVTNIKSSLMAEKGVFHLKPLAMDVFGGKGEGDVTVRTTEGDAEYEINLSVSKLDFEKVEESFGKKKVVGGKGDLDAALTVRERGKGTLLKDADGSLSLRGNNLITYTVDLDRVLSSYETSQKFTLVDMGAFLLAGPLGPVAVKGYRYGDVYYQTMGGQGVITRFVSHWKLKNGIAEATDCAFATRHNRVAVKGKLNLLTERYDNVTVALLDDKGCPTFKQTINGPFEKPQVGTVSMVESLGSPISNLYRQTKRLVQGGKCEVFYHGAVQQPR